MKKQPRESKYLKEDMYADETEKNDGVDTYAKLRSYYLKKKDDPNLDIFSMARLAELIQETIEENYDITNEHLLPLLRQEYKLLYEFINELKLEHPQHFI